jgi:hypothetical protein
MEVRPPDTEGSGRGQPKRCGLLAWGVGRVAKNPSP